MRSTWITAIPAILSAGFGLLIYILLRVRGPLSAEAFLGWLCLLLVAATVLGIAVGAYASVARRAVASAGFLWVGAMLLAGAVAVIGGHAGTREIAGVAGVFATWLALCSALAWNLRRFTAPFAYTFTLTIAMVMMASPIVANPLIRAAARWSGTDMPSPWQGRIIEVVRHGCPFLPVIDAVRPAANVEWSHLPAMYAWSGIDQNFPMPLPNVWVCAGIYGVLAVLVCAFNLRHVARNSPERNDQGASSGD
jgi:hypothetical protein